jgi:hypothetical protein
MEQGEDQTFPPPYLMAPRLRVGSSAGRKQQSAELPQRGFSVTLGSETLSASTTRVRRQVGGSIILPLPMPRAK